MSTFSERLAALGLDTSAPAHPVGAYVPAAISGNLLYTAGQLPLIAGALPSTGKVGSEVTLDEARLLARRCAINGLAAAQSAIGSLDRVTRVVRVAGYVASAADFTGQAAVLDGASEVLSVLFGEQGKHVRTAVGVAVLPLDAPLEVEMLLEFH